MQKKLKVLNKWVVLRPMEEDMTSKTSLSMPDELKTKQNIGTCIELGPDCNLAEKDGVYVYDPIDSLKLNFEGEELVIVKEKNLVVNIREE